ncbi:MAG: TlpA disulfide reductase family protein [Bacteroidota bacterium]
MWRYLIISLFFFFYFQTVQAQEFYQAKNGKKIFTKAGLTDALKKLNKSKEETYVITVDYTIVETITRNDSIINIIEIEFDGKPTRNEKVYAYEHKAFPDFKLRNLNGKKVTQKNLKGKITFINIWFVNCVPCRREMPILNRLKEKYQDKVDFKSITFDKKEAVQNFLKTNEYNYDHLINAKSFLKDELGIKSYPKIMIIDRKGIVSYVGPGIPPTFDKTTKKVLDFTEKDLVYLEAMLDKLLSE